MERQIRREESNLVVIGTGLIAFGGWLVIKILMLFFLRHETIIPSSPDRTALENTLVNIVSAVFICLLAAISLGIRLYVGLSAIAEGKGKRKRHLYVVFAVFLALAELLAVGADVYTFSRLEIGFVDTIIQIFIDLSSLYVLLVLITAAVRLRRLRKLADGKGA